MLRLKILASVVPLAIAALFARGEFLTGPRACIEIAGTSVQIATLSWQAHRHVSFTNDPSRATVRVQISDSAEAADFTVIDDVDTAEAGACESHAPPQLVAISRNPSASDPVIYLSRDGPADYRIFVSSKSFSLLDAAALIVGARGERHRVEAAALALTLHSPCSHRGRQRAVNLKHFAMSATHRLSKTDGESRRPRFNQQSQGHWRWDGPSGSNFAFAVSAAGIPG